MKLRYLFAVLLLCIPAFGQIALVGGCAAVATSCTPVVIGGGVFATGQFEYTFAYRSALTAPTLATSYTTMDTASASTSSFRSGCAVMTSSTPFNSAWTNATNVVTLIYSGEAATTTANCVTNGVGGHTAGGTSGTTSTYTFTTVTLTHGNASSWVIAAVGSSAAVCTPSTVLTAEESATDIIGHDTHGVVSSFSTLTCTGTTGNWKSDTVELLAAAAATPTFGTNGGTFGTSASTSIACATGGSTICDTQDGSTPAAATSGTCSAGSTYSSPLTISVSSATVNAICTLAGLSTSALATSSAFTLNPFLPNLASLGVSGGYVNLLDAFCSGSGTANFIACSSPMTVTAGDAITCNVTGVSGGNNETGTAMDSVNGFYDNVFGLVHPANTLSWVTTAVMQNSVGGSITPQLVYSSAPNAQGTISCYAWKGVATLNALDGGAVEQAASATVTNPTSGTAAAPTNNNEIVVAYMSRSSGTAPDSGSPWLPFGALTLVGSSNVRQAGEYQIQGTATAVNGTFIGNSTSIATVDSQLALLPAGTTGGTRSFTGIYVPYGAAGSAPTGATSAALIGAAASTLSSVHFNPASPFWTLNGTAPTYDATIAPTGTRQIMVEGVNHTYGDAGSSISIAGATATGNYSTTDDIAGMGTPHWYDFFYRMAASGATTNQGCDDNSLSGAVTEGQMITQVNYTTGSTYTWHLEGSENDASQQSTAVNFDTDYWFQMHLAGVNERNHEFKTYSKSGSIWSLLGTLQEDVLCSNGANSSCGAGSTTTAGPAATATQTGTASSGATALTLGSGTGTVNGQVVLDLVNNCIISPLNGSAWTTVASGGGSTSITLSQATSCAISATSVKFYTAPQGLVVATNGSASANSTTLTLASGTSTVNGQAIGGAGIFQGTTVSSGGGTTTITLSIPTTAALASGTGVNFWSVPSSSGLSFGKNAGGSCGITSTQWWSGVTYDPYGDWGAFAPN